MDEQIRIALVGKKKAGRTFVANYVKTHYKFKKWALNDGVNRIFRTLYDYHQYQRFHWEKIREVYDFFYAIDPEIWVKFLERRLKFSNSCVIIDDVRYVNEVKYLQALGFTIIRITAPEDRRRQYVGKQLGKTAQTGTTLLYEYFHTDKTAIYQVDYVIHNDNRDNTRLAMDHILETFGAKRRNLRRDLTQS